MSKTLQVVFDGEVFRPEDKIELRPHTRYRITIEAAESAEEVADTTAHPLTALLELAADMGITDLAVRHDHYAHGKLVENDNRAA